ncbi:SDR family oxidoreductase [uncultured Thiothrix sp.]|uniref:SDR family oxidoreductase n=1 Tax=uncultured Thiothrix sp. TaxID=223185 RepID=UPI00263688EF|nr:SDR family oxidoreductase [uncultured Thiothrix sp.]
MSKVILITGGSRGIGAATVRLAVQQAYAVCFSYHSQQHTAEALVQELRKQGGELLAIQADLSQEDDILKLFAACDQTFGRLDALVNNAGILEQQMPVQAMEAARLQRILSTNVIGSFLCAREAIKRMSTELGGRGGAIVNLSSVAARLGAPFEYVDYAASKGAIDSFTVGLAKEVAQVGIRVNAVRPGIIHTEIHASGGEPNRVERVKASIPMQRGGYPEEVARAILWLVSEQASYTSGAILEVAGGR